MQISWPAESHISDLRVQVDHRSRPLGRRGKLTPAGPRPEVSGTKQRHLTAAFGEGLLRVTDPWQLASRSAAQMQGGGSRCCNGARKSSPPGSRLRSSSRRA
jgi:hypothetical protein